MVAQNQIINKILKTKDYSIVSANALSEDYFFNYTAEFNFIKNHFNTYQVVPDLATFKANFPDFEVVDVSEPDSYLLEVLIQDYNIAQAAESFNKVKELIKSGKGAEAVNYSKTIPEKFKGTILKSTDLLSDVEKRYEDFIDRTNNFNAHFAPTGFKELDKLIGGWDRTGEFALVVARTNIGKSFVLLKSALAAAIEGNMKVGYFSGEMVPEKLGYRIDTMLSNLPNSSLVHGDMDYNFQIAYKKFLEELKNKKDKGSIKVFTPYDTGGPVTVATIESFIERENLDIIFIDQFSFLEDTHHAKASYEKASNISKDLQRLFITKKIPIIMAVQQNRTKNEDGTQDTTQIAETDQLGRDATLVFFLDRMKDNNNILKMKVGKARDNAVNISLDYSVDFNRGTWNYLPNEKDGISDKEDLEQEMSSYE